MNKTSHRRDLVKSICDGYGMELRHLRYFVAVAEERHVTRAAERLGMQQPPLSQQIKALEAELGVRLFHRRARGMEPTEAGRTFLDEARTILARLGGAIEATRRTARGEQGRLRIGVPPTGPFHPFVPAVIREFREAFPQVLVTLDECLRPELLGGLVADTLDVCFLRAALTPPEGLVVHPLLEEPMVIALPRGHRLAGRRGAREVPLEALSGEAFVVYAREQGPAIYEALIAACHAAGFSPRMGQEAPRITSALGFVAAGFGVSLVPGSVQRMKLDGLVYRRLGGRAQPRVALTLAARRGDPSAAVGHFVELVRRAARRFVAAAGKRKSLRRPA
jgi:DNA-binding transcriptional LysR family regulator